MKTNLSTRLPLIWILIALAFPAGPVTRASAVSSDAWWNEDWPYRVQLSVSDPGPTAVQPDFTALFDHLGLPGALLDLDSIRVIPYTNGIPGAPVAFEETFSTLIMDGETLNLDPTGTEPYWYPDFQTVLSLDSERFTQGISSVKAKVERKPNFPPEPGFTYKTEETTLSDWSAYETLIYDVWPEVNETAVDQTTDLYRLEFLGTDFCMTPRINGPSLGMNQWNQAHTSLQPLGDCPVSDISDLLGLRFFITTDQPGGYDVGDELTLWLDNMRLVDQDGIGEIHWLADEQVDSYYLYFDTINHTGHAEPLLMSFSGETFQSGLVGEAEAGGYFSLVKDVTASELSVWSAPTVEKVFKTHAVPVTESPIVIQAARGEMEAFQLILHPPADQDLTLTVSNLIGEHDAIPSTQIQVFRVDTVPLSRLSDFYGRFVDWPDPLFPLSPGNSLHLTAGENQLLWVRIEVPDGAPAGFYQGFLTVGSTQIPYRLEVWDFTLPETALLAISAGLEWESIFSAYGVSEADTPPSCVTQLESTVLDTLRDYHITPNPNLDAVSLYSLTNYEVLQAQTNQLETGFPVWWAFTGWDRPPFANPGVIDRPGLDARILPSLAWLDRVDGLYYTQIVDWDSTPWTMPFSNDISNGDGFLFYPPDGIHLGYDPCVENSNRLIPSIRLELLREGLEDYAYLTLLSGGKPEIGVENESDLHIQTVAFSRTAFTRIPTAIRDLRQEIAGLIEDMQTCIYLPVVTQ